MALVSPQPLIEWVTWIFPGGVKAAGAYGWQPYNIHIRLYENPGSLNLLETSESI
jgi:hypothetical protein